MFKRGIALAIVLMTSYCQAQTIIIKAGKLLDVESGRLLANQYITVQDKKIQSISSHTPTVAEAKFIDLSALTVLLVSLIVTPIW